MVEGSECSDGVGGIAGPAGRPFSLLGLRQAAPTWSLSRRPRLPDPTTTTTTDSSAHFYVIFHSSRIRRYSNLLDTSARPDSRAQRQTSWTPMDLPQVSNTTGTAITVAATTPDAQRVCWKWWKNTCARAKSLLDQALGNGIVRASLLTHLIQSGSLFLCDHRIQPQPNYNIFFNLIIHHEWVCINNDGDERESRKHCASTRDYVASRQRTPPWVFLLPLHKHRTQAATTLCLYEGAMMWCRWSS